MKPRLRRQTKPPVVASNQAHLHPMTVFLVVYVIYNLLGLLNMPWTVSGAYDKSLPWMLFLLGLSGCLLGYILFGRQQKILFASEPKPRRSKQLGVLFTLIFFACLAATVASNGGIPLFLGETRFSGSALLFNSAQLLGFWVLLRTISDLEDGRGVKKTPILLYTLGILAFGYRTPALVIALVLYVYLVTFKWHRRKSLKYGVFVALAFISFSAIFAGYRVSQNYDTDEFFKNIDSSYVAQHPYLVPLVPALSTFDFSQNTIYNISKSLHSPMYGELFASNYITLLPGSHWGARNIIGNITGARWVGGRPMSITPTLQGALYTDFGYVGVFLGLFLIASGICLLGRYASGRAATAKFGFCFILTLSLLSVHNGYWDVNVLFFCFFMLILLAFDLIKARNHEPPAHSVQCVSHGNMPARARYC